MNCDNKGMRLIARGKTASVYLKDNVAYKCFPDSWPEAWIDHEIDIHQIIQSHTNIEMPAYQKTACPRMIRMSYIEGIELTERIRVHKYKEGLNDLIDLQLMVQSHTGVPLPDLHASLERHLMAYEIDQSLEAKALESLSRIDKGHALCHLDFHFSNILYAQGRYVIIDWANAKSGNPILDVARTYVILRQYAFRLSGPYLKTITKRMGIPLHALDDAIVVMAIHRLAETDAVDARQRLHDLIDQHGTKST